MCFCVSSSRTTAIASSTRLRQLPQATSRTIRDLAAEGCRWTPSSSAPRRRLFALYRHLEARRPVGVRRRAVRERPVRVPLVFHPHPLPPLPPLSSALHQLRQ